MLFKLITLILLLGYCLNIWITVHMFIVAYTTHDFYHIGFGIFCRSVGIIIFPIGGIQGFFNE
jgi:hypothetical protein